MERFKKFAHRQFKSLNKHLEGYKDKKDPELVHKIRVDIKKIKAILSVINDCLKGFRAHKNFIPFRTIFRRAGEIRDPEVLTALLLEYGIPDVHDSMIDQNGDKVIVRFCQDVPLFTNSANKQWKRIYRNF
jgi:CHAD domain-containing protein